VRNSDKIVVLDDGRVAEVGTHRELMRLGGVYKQLYEMQFKYGAEAEEPPKQDTVSK
jgi:ABC-type multidrug transport system fused ATPase/permease subunit